MKKKNSFDAILESSDSISSTTITSGFLIKTDELSSSTLSQPLPSLIINPTTCKQEINSPSSILANGAAKITNKILIDHTKQSNSQLILSPSSLMKSEQVNSNESPSNFHSNLLHSSLLSSPRSAFSRTSKTSIHSPDQRRVPKGIFFVFIKFTGKKKKSRFFRRIRFSIISSIAITFK
jgi:hypothetical protein